MSTHDILKNRCIYNMVLLFVCVSMLARSFSVPPPQQEHEEDGAEQYRERAHSGNNDLGDHLHVAGQRVCKAQTRTTHRCYCTNRTLFTRRIMMLEHSTQRVNTFPLSQILLF